MESKKFINTLIGLFKNVLCFLLAAWFFLGLSPYETYTKTIHQMTQYKNVIARQLHLFFDASSRLGEKANKYGLKEAQDVRAGKDYYSDYNSQIDAELREQLGK